MSKYYISQGHNVSGSISVSGAKNSVLPILASTILFNDDVHISNVPDVTDVNLFLSILRKLGAKITRPSADSLIVNCKNIKNSINILDDCKQFRASILIAGALLSRCNESYLPIPGGCVIGSRPIDFHLDVFKCLNIEMEQQSSNYYLSTSKIIGNDIFFDKKSVGATQNAILASVYCKGETNIYNAACEPEVVQLCEFLNESGAKITGIGSPIINIIGITVPFKSGKVKIIPDRIESLSYIVLSCVLRKDLTILNTDINYYRTELNKLEKAGLEYNYDHGNLILSTENLKSVNEISTSEYPGFSTDAQSLFMALAMFQYEPMIIKENIFENRFMLCNELQKLGANIHVTNNTAFVRPFTKHFDSECEATDLRTGMALIITAIGLNKDITIGNISHVKRGYNNIVEKLNNIGVLINEKN